jgi:transcriptional accessory protein Tex/SPT6
MSQDDFQELLKSQLSENQFKKTEISSLYFKYNPQKRSFSDFADIVGIHPLELWLAAYLYHHPNADYEEVYQKSKSAKLDAYRWLFRTDGFFVHRENLNRTNESAKYLNKMLLIRFTRHGNDWVIHSRNWFPPMQRLSVVLQIDRKP